MRKGIVEMKGTGSTKERLHLDIERGLKKKIEDYCLRKGVSVSSMNTILWRLFLYQDLGSLGDKLIVYRKRVKLLKEKVEER